MDDYCPKGKLRGEHGLSYNVVTAEANILFDTGQTDAFIQNARFLGVDLAGLDAVVLSHGHYDHCGGLAALFKSIAPAHPELFAGRGYATPKRARTEAGLSDIGIPAVSLASSIPAAFEVDELLEFRPGMFLLPRAERRDGSIALPRFRILDEGVERLDEFEDEVSMVIDGKDGLVVMTGCAHRGILNIAEAARKAFPGRPVSALVGGFHVSDAPEETLARVTAGIALLAPRRIYCGHCTGVRGFAAISAGNRDVTWLSCGMRVEL